MNGEMLLTIISCPNCKAIDKVILEGVFLEVLGLLDDNVLDLIMTHVEEALSNDEDIGRKKQIDKDISSMEYRKSRMTDMLIDGTITKEVYVDKLIEITRKLHDFTEEKHIM